MAVKKLIEVALPLDAINEASAREKSIRHGHPSTLHLWWARRPLAAARAVIWASLVDDPSSHPELFPTEEAQDQERERLFRILEDLVLWENSNDERVLSAAKEEITKYVDEVPELLDPFAGGGAIPLEAQRLGLVAHAHDLNPVAVIINKAMIEIPPKFAGQPAVNPDSQAREGLQSWVGNAGLAADVEYYANWMKDEAFKRIGHLYPKVKVPPEQGGGEATVIAWIWTRTIKCPNPACGHETILARTFDLSKRKGHEAHVEVIAQDGEIKFEVLPGKSNVAGTVNRNGATCVHCGEPIDFEYIRSEASLGNTGVRLMGIVAEGNHGRIFLAPNPEQEAIAATTEPARAPKSSLPKKALGFRVQAYGVDEYKKLFTKRQLTMLTTLTDLVQEAQRRAQNDAEHLHMRIDETGLEGGGSGAKSYGQAVGVYLALLVDKLADYHSTVCAWHTSREMLAHTFGRQAIPMVWDFAEGNIFCDSTGSLTNMLTWITKCICNLPREAVAGIAKQADAQSDIGLRNIMVSTDPPYYDNIDYSDLSDFFYIWLRQSLKDVYPKLFSTMLVPKTEELIADPYRDNRGVEGARDFFEAGMLEAIKKIYLYTREDIPVSIYYAFKQSETENTGDDEATASTGWEAMLTAIIRAGFTITGTWPIRTEMSNRPRALTSNALASSVVLVCRKRKEGNLVCTRREFMGALKRELKPALDKLQSSNIAPVDLAQSAIGPGIGIYSRYAQVLEADGTEMSVRTALQLINQELDLYLSDQDDDLDPESRFCVTLYEQNGLGDVEFGEADVLARAKNTSVNGLQAAGVLEASHGIVHLNTRDAITTKIDTSEKVIWKLTQQLAHSFEAGGVVECAKVIADHFRDAPEQVKALAYRLFTIADKKDWTQDAYAYNALVIAWPEIQAKVAQIKAEEAEQKPEQSSFFSDTDL